MRSIPSIEQLRQRPAMRPLEAQYGRAALVEALRQEADALRQRVRAGEDLAGDAAEVIERAVPQRLSAMSSGSLRRIINATGVIVHTNLGRAPLARAAADRVASLARGYTNLEYDLDAGRRGRRDEHASRLICRLTDATAAVVVNNNAAAALVTLAALASGREAIVSRGELVEIGGGFRVPDVMAQSGAVLREVGTTNRTRAADYAAAINDRTALILRVHPSNFRIEGFTERPALAELVEIGRKFNIPVVEDLGSGWMGSRPGLPGTPAPWLPDEPIVSESIAAGADVVTFSGDKLLGGPQAGIIAGAEAPLALIRRHPLMRALRVDKMTYAALEATLLEYAAGRAGESIPVLKMMSLTADAIERRARALAEGVAGGSLEAQVVDGFSTVGGGSAPGSALPTKLVALSHATLGASALEGRLRSLDPPVIARIESERVVIDLRTVPDDDDGELARLLTSAPIRDPSR